MGQIRQPTYTTDDIDPETGKRRRHTSAVWWIRYYRNGKRHEESSHSTRKGDAIDLLRRREGAIANGEPVTAKIGRLTFDEAVKDVETDYRINDKRSLEHVIRRITLHLTPYFGSRRMAAISSADLRAFVAHRQATDAEEGDDRRRASNAEINRELAIVKRAFRLARQSGKLLHVPHIPMLVEHNVRQGFFEPEQFAAVRDALPDALRGVATFAYLTGWRIRSEVLSLTWSQVNRASMTVRLEPGMTKNAEGRTLPYALLPELVTLIETQWAAHEQLKKRDLICPFVFHRDGSEIRSFRKVWHSACATAGYPGKIPHDFRRTAVRNLVRAGVPEKTAMAITGHKTRSVFDRYDIVNEADLRTAMGKLAGAPEDTKGQGQGKSRRSGRVAAFSSRKKSA